MSHNNFAIPLVDGPELIAHFEDALSGARQYIYIAAWMLHFDLPIGNHTLLDLLQTKVNDGTDVRILLSDLDPTLRLSVSDSAKLQIIDRWERRRIRQVNATGVKVCVSALEPQGLAPKQLATMASRSIGYSIRLAAHHQKFIVVDSSIAFCMGSDLVKLICYPARYHEVAAMVRGPVARCLEQLFVKRWNVEAPQAGFDRITQHFRARARRSTVAVLRTTPARRFPTRAIRKAYSAAINGAQRTIYIENQYFRDHTVAAALISALRRGVDVRIVLPNLPNEIHVGDGSLRSIANSVCIFSQYRVLKSLINLDPAGLFLEFASLQRLKAKWPHNLSVVRPTPERNLYIHSKLMIVDDRLTIVGSANLNGRSMNGKCDSELALMIDNSHFASLLRRKLAQSIDEPGLAPYDEATLERDEEMSRIDEGHLHELLRAAGQRAESRLAAAIPIWLPTSMRNMAEAVGRDLFCKILTRFLHAGDRYTFRDRLNNLTVDYI